jgi:hypothetical protein
MRTLKSLAALAAFAVVTAGCESSPSEPELVSTEAAIESALLGGGEAVSDFTPQPAILARLTNAALLHIRQHHGREAARAALVELQPWFEDLRDARQTGDSAQVRAAMQALRQAEAAFIVSTLGTSVVTRALEFADARLDRLEQMIQYATAVGRDPERMQDLATSLRTILDDAGIAAAAGDHAAALIAAADVINGLHFMRPRAR